MKKELFNDAENGDIVSAIKNRLFSKEIGKSIYYQEEVGSTNTVAKELADAGKTSGTLVVADFQSQGKGRRGRTWVAPKGKDIFMSLLLRPAIKPEQASMLTLVMGLSVTQAVNKHLGLNSQIKWPNDVVADGKKICGILTEMKANANGIEYVVIGTGINCNTKEFAEAELTHATSLILLMDQEIEREALLAEVLAIFERNYNTFLQTKDMTNLLDSYNSLLANAGREVKISGMGDELIGEAKGINERGELLVKDKKGEIKTVFTGEVSVRGVYGYV